MKVDKILSLHFGYVPLNRHNIVAVVNCLMLEIQLLNAVVIDLMYFCIMDNYIFSK